MKSEKKAKRVPSLDREGLSSDVRDLLSRATASPSPERVFGLEPAAADAMARGRKDGSVCGRHLSRPKWPIQNLLGPARLTQNDIPGVTVGTVPRTVPGATPRWTLAGVS
jgi:hypothetical protein